MSSVVMTIVESEFASSRDPRFAARLAEHATGAAPVWLWSADGSRILWTNAVGAAIFGAANTGAWATRRFDAKDRAAVEIVRLAATLPPIGQARLERLRGFGARFGRALTCICSRFPLSDDSAALLVVATEPVGPSLPLRERVSRLFPDCERALAVFAPDGALLYATEAAQRLGATTVPALGISGLVSQALAAGSAEGMTDYGPVTVERLGSDASTALVVTFNAPNQPHAAEEAAAKIAPAVSPPAPPAASTTPAQPAPPAASPPASRSPARDDPIVERRHPLRFVWQMDADGRFTVGSDEFIVLLGAQTAAAFGRPWSEIAAEFKLDPQNQIADAVATRETWSGVTLRWPVDGGGEPLPIELSGLPVFGREREFLGYRGFGVCRDVARINQLARARRERPTGFMAQPQATAASDDATTAPERAAPASAAAAPASPSAAETTVEVAATPSTERAAPIATPSSANVVPFRPGPPPEPKAPSLSPVERQTFGELAQELTARLQGGRQPPAASEPPPAAVHEDIGPQREAALPAFAPVLLDRLPLGVLIYRNETLLYANRHLLEMSGYQNLDALVQAGGLNVLFAEPDAEALADSEGVQSLSIMTSGGGRSPVEGRLFTVPWRDASALALILTDGEGEERRRATALSLTAAENEIRALKSRIESFGRTEQEMRATIREAQKTAAAKAEFVGKVSHEIRTPLNAITGFVEVIMAERFGPIGNERYREYLKDIHAAGTHLVSLLNDLLDLSKVESGQLDLTFGNVSLNDLTQQCVGIMQPQASRGRIIIRTALTPGLPQVVADERSLRQIVLNLLSNSISFTGPGGQVIVSTAFADSGEAVLRVRDTGVGMSEKDVEAALEPFRHTATSASLGSGGTGLGLPLTKALAEANRAHFSIKSAPNAGTLIEVAFPPTRVVAR